MQSCLIWVFGSRATALLSLLGEENAPMTPVCCSARLVCWILDLTCQLHDLHAMLHLFFEFALRPELGRSGLTFRFSALHLRILTLG